MTAGAVRFDSVVKRHGSTTVLHGIDLEIQAGEFFVLLGPSGSGKTTTLRILAGLESVQGGRVLIDGLDVTHHEPGERDVAMVFQSYALYPHLTVADNIGFPLKMIGTPAPRIRTAVEAAAARVGIGHLLGRRPGALSGGQQQRCALARAIVRQPKLFLLDEPLSNLDAKLRLETRVELRKLQRSLGVTTVYVTHDQEEAMTLADRVAVFMDGRIVQIGTPQQIFARPDTVSVAGFIGTPPMNLLPGVLEGDRLTVGDWALDIGNRGLVGSGPLDVIVGVRPADLRLAPAGLAARIELIEDLGDSYILDLLVGDRPVRLKRNTRPVVTEGEVLRIDFDPAAAHLFDASSGRRIAVDLSPCAAMQPSPSATQASSSITQPTPSARQPSSSGRPT